MKKYETPKMKLHQLKTDKLMDLSKPDTNTSGSKIDDFTIVEEGELF